MIFENDVFNNIKPYTVASHEIWNVKSEERLNILKLDWNESTCSPPSFIINDIKRLLDTNFINLYPETYNDELYKLLSDYTKLPIANIQYFAGSDLLHEYISRIYLNKNSSILIIRPSYDNFRLTAESSGCKIIYYDIKENFLFDFDDYVNAINNSKPNVVYLCNPNNPIGFIISSDLIGFLIKKFPNVLFIIDEAYIEFDISQSSSDFVIDNDNLLITRTMSKAFGLANLRFGYLLASKNNVNTINKIRNSKCISTITQTAVVSALNHIDYMYDYVSEVNRARDYLINYINSIGNDMHAFVSHSNFVLVKCKDYNYKINVINFLKNNNIYVRNLEYADVVKNCFRISIGTYLQMEKVCLLLKNM